MPTKRLTCGGISIGDLAIPAFEVSIADYVGLADSASSSVQRYELMQVLGGLRTTNSIHITGKSSVIVPPGFEMLEQTGLRTITDIAMAKGMSCAAAEGVFTDLGLKADLPYCHLQLTPRLRLELKLAWTKGAELVVFSTDGLDPSGIASVVVDVSKMLGQCSAIHVFPMALIKYYESLNVYSKMVRCNLVKGS